MLLHDSSFFRVQRTGFKKNAFWHVNFSYVVEPTGDAEFVQVVVSKTEAFSQLLCVCHKKLECPLRKFCFESTLRASANTADFACSSMYFLSRKSV